MQYLLRLIVILCQNARLPHNQQPHAHLIHTYKMNAPKHASQAKNLTPYPLNAPSARAPEKSAIQHFCNRIIYMSFHLTEFIGGY